MHSCPFKSTSLAMTPEIEQSHLLNADETRKRITILPEKLSDDAKLILKRLFDSNLYEMDRKAVNTMLVASRAPSATARAAFIRSQQQHLSVTAAAASRKGKCTALGDELDAAIAASAVERVKELERENERLREERTCKVCLDAAAAVLFDPCGHLSTCSRCSSSLTECPICRRNIKRKITAFM